MADTSVFLGLKYMSLSLMSQNIPPSHLLAEVMAVRWLLGSGAIYPMADVQESSVGGGQPKGQAAYSPLNQGLSEGGRGGNQL